MILLISGVFAQNSKLEEIKIKTSSQCDMCKERIEEALAFEKGVKKSVISKVGYDADNVMADPKAYAKLDACCKKPEDPDAQPH